MRYKALLKANFKRHRGGLLGIFALMLISAISLSIALAVVVSSSTYIESEITRMGYGDLTAWVSKLPNIDTLKNQLLSQSSVGEVGIQPLIHSSYTINDMDSDSEGQLILYQPEEYQYKLFTDDLKRHSEDKITINKGEIYLSPSMISSFNVKLGDEISFSIARSGGEEIFTVKGFFEDSFMGSSMIGMKGFLIGEEDFIRLSERIESAGIEALARTGAMLHIFKSSPDSITEWNSKLNRETELSQYTEFAHSRGAITDFMLLLQRIFAGFLLAFVVVLLAVSMLMLGHIINSSIQRDKANIGILKSLGFTTQMLRTLQLIEYLAVIILGIIVGVLGSLPLIPIANRMTLTTTGIMAPNTLPIGICLIVFLIILAMLGGFISLKIGSIGGIRPLHAILGLSPKPNNSTSMRVPIKKNNLSFWIALRQLTDGKKQYISAFMIAILLVFLSSMVGRVNSWLGTDGKGLMEAFNPADHDIGIQRFGKLSFDEIENIILEHTSITDSYMLAMPSVTVNGIDYSANVITEPERFHILEGRTCLNDNEVVLTDITARDLNVSVGEVVAISGKDYIVSGIYQCANDMGANLGMSRAAYEKITTPTEELWCMHYFLEDNSKKPEIIKKLSDTYGGDVHIHENDWPGLYGIINAMKVLMAVMYMLIFAVILIAVLLTSQKLLETEQKNLGIYKSIGFSDSLLERSFAIRFTLVALFGSGVGLIMSSILTDPLIASIMKICGISNFVSKPSLQAMLLPLLITTVLFAIFSYISSFAIRRINLSLLISE